MRNAYKYLALVIAVDVLLQAASVAYGAFGLQKWIEDGHTLGRNGVEDGSYPGVGGYAFHGANGMMVMLLLGVALLVVALVGRLAEGPRDAAILLVMIVVQIALGFASHAVPLLGAVHGILALVIFAYAAMIGVRVMLSDKRAVAA